MKLEKLVVYLTYKLRIKTYEDKIGEMFSIDIRAGMIEFKEKSGLCHYENEEGFKPILRPMKDLPTFKPALDELNTLYNLDFLMPIIENLDFSITPYAIVLILAKHHFDVFGLLDKNEGIDINTITQ